MNEENHNQKALEKIKRIWIENGAKDFDKKITKHDQSFINIEANGKPFIMWYGNHCGPAYGKPNMAPKNALDLLCKCHDTFYSLNNADQCLDSSVKVLFDYDLIKKETSDYAKAMQSKNVFY
jgi:hypothetical protein